MFSARKDSFYSFYTEDKINLFNKRYIENTQSVHSTEYYEAYLNIIRKCAQLCRELNVTDPNKVSVLFEYLLWNGYFSKDKTLLYSSDRQNIIGFYGADVILGKAACINFSSMLTLLMNELDIEAYLMGCNINIKEFRYVYRPAIIKKHDKENMIFKTPKKGSGILPLNERANHAITIYRNKKGFSYSDVTNLMFLDNTGFLRASYVGSNANVLVKPYIFLLENVVSYESFLELFNDIFKTRNRDNMNIDEMIEISEDVMALCERNINLFNDFHIDINKDIECVCKILKR